MIKQTQDNYCATVLAGNWGDLSSDFPEEFQWEQLVEVLRGRVKVHTHCYEATDFDSFIRVRFVTTVQNVGHADKWRATQLSQEFEFPIAAFHHANEAYLVPDLLKQAYGTSIHIPAFITF